MSKRSAASAHWVLRCWVGTTTTTRRAVRAVSARQTAASAKLVLPAPGVATARKSALARASNAARASRCQGRRRRARSGPGCGGWGESCSMAKVEEVPGSEERGGRFLSARGQSVDPLASGHCGNAGGLVVGHLLSTANARFPGKTAVARQRGKKR